MEADILLDVKDLYTWFAGKKAITRAVNGVSFSVHRGEVFGLVGESGCGKSVTCRSLIRLIQNDGQIVSGSIMYSGKNLTTLSERELSKIRGTEIAMIFQEPMNTLNPVSTIGTQLCEAMKEKELTKTQKRNRAVELLRMVGIPSPELRLDSFPHEFSGGMRQRAMIAIALAARPRLLLADEPTTALDVTIQDQIIKLLQKLIRELDMSMILVTHDLGVASLICDNIAVMYAGSIMEIADTESLFSQPRHPYTYGLMRSLPRGGTKKIPLTPIAGMPPVLTDHISGCPFAPRCPFCETVCITNYKPVLTEITGTHFSHCVCLDKMREVTYRPEAAEEVPYE